MPDDRTYWFRRVSEWVIGPLLLGVWGFRVSGRERLPERGPFIMASNHCSIVDGPLLVMAAGLGHPLRFMGKKSLFALPVLGWYLRGLGMFPLDRKGDVGALRQALAILESGGSMGIFPEGTRSKTGEPGRPRAGVGFLAGKTGARVVPARIVGSHRFPWARPLEVRIGAPIAFTGDPDDHGDCQAFADKVMERIAEL